MKFIIYRFVRPGESFRDIPARDLTAEEYRQHTADHTPGEKALIKTLYTRAEVADEAPAAPAVETEEATNGNTNGV